LMGLGPVKGDGGAASQGEAAFEKAIWQPLLYRYGRTLTP